MADEEQQPPPTKEEETPAPPAEQNGDSSGEVIGSAAIRPVFLGNLKPNYVSEEVEEIFTRPIAPPGTPEGTYTPFPVDRVDLKRGYCFVFLKDAASQADKVLRALGCSPLSRSLPNLHYPPIPPIHSA
jgi:hypothetical protein